MSLASLLFLTACSSNNGSPGIKCPGATGSYTNGSLGPSGTQWTYSLSGWFLNSSGTYSPYTEVGTFTVNGAGRITGGFDDFFGGTVAGNYSIVSNGTGTINVTITNNTGAQSLVWGITLANPGITTSVGSFALIEGDSFANAHGSAYQQNPAALTSPPSGTFVFRNHVLTSGTSIAGSRDSVGLITFNPATLAVTVNDDYNNSGVAGQSTNFAGTFTAPSGGIGTLTFSDGLGAQTFDYFVIDGNDLVFYETDSYGGLALGRAELQQPPTGGFTNSSFSGSYAFGSKGDTTSSAAGGVNSVGQFATDGSGNITGGSLDWVRDGSPQLTQTISASTYTLAANGRVTTTLPASGAGNVGEAIYLVSPSRAFFLVTSDTSRVEDGTMDIQSTNSFSASNFSGQYAFVMGGLSPSSTGAVPLDRTGTIQADGNGNLGWAEQVNSGGNPNAVCLVGTSTVSTNGRVSASVNTLSNSLVFYLISQNGGYALQADPGTQISGGMVNQNQPVPVVPGIF